MGDMSLLDDSAKKMTKECLNINRGYSGNLDECSAYYWSWGTFPLLSLFKVVSYKLSRVSVEIQL